MHTPIRCPGGRARISACAIIVSLVACSPSHAATAPCPAGISPETAQRVFERVKSIAPGDGYHLDGGGATAAELVVNFSLNGMPCPPIRVHVGNCKLPLMNPKLELDVPAELNTQCPGLRVVVDAIATILPAERLFGQQLEPPAAAIPMLIVIAALIMVGGLAIRRLLRINAATAFAWGDLAWIAFVIGATIPFFENVPLAVNVELGVAWIAFTILLARLFARNLIAGESRAHKQLLLGLFLFTLALDWMLSSGGPGDLHLNLTYIWGAGLELRWGPAPIALFRLLGFIFSEVHDTEILWLSLLLGGLLPLLLYGIVRDLGVASGAALAAAFVAAAHPLLIAFSGVLNRQTPYLFATFGSLLALISVLRRGRSADFLAFVLGTVLAATSRPEGVQVLVVHGAVLLIVAATARVRVAVALALVLLAAFGQLYTHQALELKPPASSSLSWEHPILWTVLFDKDFTPTAWIVAWLLGLLVGIRRRAAWVAALALLGLDLLWRWSSLYRMFVGHPQQVASARYESIMLVPFAIGVALLFQSFTKTTALLKLGVAVAFLALTAATFGESFDTLLKPFTVDHEYRFLKKHAATLPAGSRLYTLDAPFDDTGFLDAHMVGAFVPTSVRFGLWSERRCDDLRDPAGAYLYIGSACAELIDNKLSPLPSPGYWHWIEECTAIRTRLSSDVVEEIDVPARKMSWHYFKESKVRLGIYRVKDPALCELGPTSAPH